MLWRHMYDTHQMMLCDSGTSGYAILWYCCSATRSVRYSGHGQGRPTEGERRCGTRSEFEKMDDCTANGKFFCSEISEQEVCNEQTGMMVGMSFYQRSARSLSRLWATSTCIMHSLPTGWERVEDRSDHIWQQAWASCISNPSLIRTYEYRMMPGT